MDVDNIHLVFALKLCSLLAEWMWELYHRMMVVWSSIEYDAALRSRIIFAYYLELLSYRRLDVCSRSYNTCKKITTRYKMIAVIYSTPTLK